MNNYLDDKELLEQLQQLTLERLRVMPKNTELAIGSDKLQKEDLIKHVSISDDLGKQVMLMQLEFLQDMASGEIYKDDNSDHTLQTR